MNTYRGKHSSSAPWPSSTIPDPGYRPRHVRKNPRKRGLLIFLYLIVLVVLLYPFVNPLFISVDYKSLKSEDLPVDIGHLRIVYLSDIHYGYFFSDARLTALVHRINELNPDLVLFGGDYAADATVAISFFNRLPSVHSRYGIFGVLGESEREDRDTNITQLLDTMKNRQVTPLVNKMNRVAIGASSVCVAGLDEPIYGKPDPEGLASVTSSDDYVILLSHNPSTISTIQSSTDQNDRVIWFDIALFGHTHGGQIAGFSQILNIAPDVEDRYLGGWLNENRTDMLVSNGVGTSVFPIRICCPAQIHCIDISR